jgi:hypothetical protein
LINFFQDKKQSSLTQSLQKDLLQSDEFEKLSYFISEKIDDLSFSKVVEA